MRLGRGGVAEKEANTTSGARGPQPQAHQAPRGSPIQAAEVGPRRWSTWSPPDPYPSCDATSYSSLPHRPSDIFPLISQKKKRDSFFLHASLYYLLLSSSHVPPAFSLSLSTNVPVFHTIAAGIARPIDLSSTCQRFFPAASILLQCEMNVDQRDTTVTSCSTLDLGNQITVALALCHNITLQLEMSRLFVVFDVILI